MHFGDDSLYAPESDDLNAPSRGHLPIGFHLILRTYGTRNPTFHAVMRLSGPSTLH